MLTTGGLVKTTNRRLWLVGGVIIAGAVFLIPILVFAPNQEPAAIAIAQFLICGILLGLGRQGIDVLELRLFVASLGLLVGAVISQQQHQSLACVNAVKCTQLLVLLGITVGAISMVVLSLIAVPTAAIWSRGIGPLQPELNWPAQIKWWHWLVLALIAIPVVGVLLGIPWPA